MEVPGQGRDRRERNFVAVADRGGENKGKEREKMEQRY